MMRAWVTAATPGVLELAERPRPSIANDELLVRVEACAVCRTDLHVVDQDLPVHHPGVIPGHEVVGTVVDVGDGVRSITAGERVGIAWLRRTCGVCRWCREGHENLCPDSRYTGWDVDGGYADFVTVPEQFAYPVPDDQDPVDVAPLLCAGIIGFRALARANVPPGGRLGIYGYGSSGHITAQLAMASGAEVSVMTRGEHNRRLARSAGAAFVGEAYSLPPTQMDAVIVFAPVGDLVPVALRATIRGGTVVLAGIHMSSLPPMDYGGTLYLERDLRTVTANTRADGDTFLRVARRLGITPSVTRYPLQEAGRALDDIREGRHSGSLVIAVGS